MNIPLMELPSKFYCFHEINSVIGRQVNWLCFYFFSRFWLFIRDIKPISNIFFRDHWISNTAKTIYLSKSIYLSLYTSIYYLFIYLSIYLSTYLSIYLIKKRDNVSFRLLPISNILMVTYALGLMMYDCRLLVPMK